jgi:hypothetical protein
MTGTWESDDPKIASLLTAERQTMAQLREQGLVEQLLLRVDGAGAYMVVSAESEEQARGSPETLPFVKQTVMRFELVEIRA